MKVIAYYLPQYHRTEENDRWWGKGFTEWTNVKRAKAINKNHEQPKIPLNDNYYNLLDYKTLKWQAELLNQYKVEGLAIYHYWFKGERLLDKPAENILKWKDLPLKYCFFWANHTWNRSWEGNTTILKEQLYGEKEEWEEHFQYLLPFFKDSRYLKKDNKPIFIIYNSSDISKYNERIEYLNKRSKDFDFSGIYIIESIQHCKKSTPQKGSDGILYSEPAYTMSQNNIFLKIKHRFLKKYTTKVMTYNGKKILLKMLNKKIKYEKKDHYLGSFHGWDNTARHNSRGYIIPKVEQNFFEKILAQQQKWMEKNNSEYIFYNAWNEWAEGMYLEPDKKNKYKDLECIKKITEKGE